MKLWQKKYKLNKEIELFTVGNDFLLDKKLIKFDCIASIAHAKMLAKIKILNKKECSKLIKALNEIIKLNSKEKFEVKQENEDCHTAIENYLTKKLGSTGKKIHSCRSRNDQIATALRLYFKEEINSLKKLSDEFIKELAVFKKKYGNIKMPGFTHTKKAMPSSVELWVNAFIDSMKDNQKMLFFVNELLDQCPLGTGAGYGLPIKVDRKFTAKILGFKKIQKNSIYVQNSRGKFESSLMHSLNQVMFDLNKMASDIIFFSVEGLDYFELKPEICTGSSIMPHKKNPDALEIMRAKYHQNLSFEFQIKSLTSNLISGYHRDLQLTKEPIIKGIENTKQCLQTMKIVLKNIKVNKKNCENAVSNEMHSVKQIHKLIKKGVAFRDAYSKISIKFLD